MGKITSNTAVANNAIIAVKFVTVSKSTQIPVEKSTVSGLRTGVSVSNQLVSDLEQLVTCVKDQSERFPKLAAVNAFRAMQTKF
ncbi:MAG: hypothetical protein IC227_00195 [Enterococcus lacertideformus]|uniref:Uncharacterized protein n=1 Tax=Enterococcus lacertideformus TaxID=2771493 RepID=A0A931FA53_9ENTE|nr:hypothetical protein [Enterococcus lacertideformus]